jgi:hypothetical protein
MALSDSILGSLIDTNLSAFGANGSNRTLFCNKVAKGIVMSIVGKSFSTNDVGTTPGSGTGTGTGITGLVSSLMVSSAIAVLPSTGVNANKLFTAIMNAVVSHLASAAELNSTHSPVYTGTGTIVIGSITVSIPEMANNIKAQLLGAGAIGVNLTILCTAIATGIVTGILTGGTGSVTITGDAPPSPVPGTGTGSGIIS